MSNSVVEMIMRIACKDLVAPGIPKIKDKESDKNPVVLEIMRIASKDITAPRL
jgi:hypothetical protein